MNLYHGFNEALRVHLPRGLNLVSLVSFEPLPHRVVNVVHSTFFG
jgi:hypothetical protein